MRFWGGGGGEGDDGWEMNKERDVGGGCRLNMMACVTDPTYGSHFPTRLLYYCLPPLTLPHERDIYPSHHLISISQVSSQTPTPPYLSIAPRRCARSMEGREVRTSRTNERTLS